MVCGSPVIRTGSRGPIPKYCGRRCIAKSKRTDQRREYERLYRRTERAKGWRSRYEYRYNRRPEVRKRNADRMRAKWHNDPEYRARELLRMRSTIHPEIVLAAPYTGHRWLQMAHDVVRKDGFDTSAPWADDYWDDMGEAVLALLEGRDMKEAVRGYRKKEYVARRLTQHLGDWGDVEEAQNRWFESVMPTVESAEDEALAHEAVVFYAKTRFSNVSTKNRRMKHKTSTPSNRRSNHR